MLHYCIQLTLQWDKWIYHSMTYVFTWLGMHHSLTHWGRVTHICVSELTIIGSDNGLSPGRRQAIIWTNAVILSIGPLGTNFSEISIAIQTFSFKKMHLNMSSAKWRPFCLGLNVLALFGLVPTVGMRDFGHQWSGNVWHYILVELNWMFIFSSRWCQVENEDVVGAAPTGAAPTTSEWSLIWFPIKVQLILDIWQ